MIIIPIDKLNGILAKWRILLIIISIVCLVTILLYNYYPPFRNALNRYLSKDIESQIFDILMPIFIGTIIAIFASGRKKKREIVIKNSKRLGILFQKTDDGYQGEYKGKKIKYTFSGGKEKHDYAELRFFHHRPLNLGLYLIIKEPKYSRWFLDLRLFLTQGLTDKRIPLPGLLQEKIICWATEEIIAKQLILNRKISDTLSQLIELVQKDKGHLLVDDIGITMQFPFNTILNINILESAYQLSTAFTNSIMLPQQLARSHLIWRAIYRSVLAIITISLIAYWGWSIIAKLK